MTGSRIACIMPFLNEARSLPAVLATLAVQQIERERLYFIAVDSGSNDGSADVVLAWLKSARIAGHVENATSRGIPQALNAGLAVAHAADIIVRLDAHTLYDPLYLATLVSALDELPEDVWCVGGAPTPAPAVDFATSLGAALYGNPMGLGPADFRQASKGPRRVSTVYLGAWRPGVLQRLGGWDERWAANEDCELTERIAAAGGAIVRVPVRCGVISNRPPAATIVQRFRYAYWRMQTFKRYPRAVRMRHIVPPLVLALGLALAASRRVRLLAALYAPYASATIALRPRGERPAISAATLVYFPLVHAAYALGLIAGLLHTPASLRR
jgi:glycosyltransferase involved in cell wall biosynthesis